MTQSLNNRKAVFAYQRFKSALHTMQEAIMEPDRSNKYLRDATIQRFEYTYEASWKALKYILESKGMYLKYPSDLFGEAFASGWINDAEKFNDMILSRNATSHTYAENKAEEIYEKICSDFYPELKHLQMQLEGVIYGRS